MSNAASLRGPRRVRPAPSSPPPLPARASSSPPPLPAKAAKAPQGPQARPTPSMTTQPTPQTGHAPVRIVVRSDAPVPQTSAASARLLGTTMRVDRGVRASAPPEQAWKPFRGFIVGASLGAAVMMVFTASGSERVRDMRARVASSLRTMKSELPARVDLATSDANANASTTAAPSMVVPVVEMQTTTTGLAASPTPPSGANGIANVSPTPAPAACATPSRTSAAPAAIPQLDVMQLPKAKPAHPARAKRAPQNPRVESHDDEPEARSGDEA